MTLMIAYGLPGGIIRGYQSTLLLRSIWGRILAINHHCQLWIPLSCFLILVKTSVFTFLDQTVIQDCNIMCSCTLLNWNDSRATIPENSTSIWMVTMHTALSHLSTHLWIPYSPPYHWVVEINIQLTYVRQCLLPFLQTLTPWRSLPSHSSQHHQQTAQMVSYDLLHIHSPRVWF